MLFLFKQVIIAFRNINNNFISIATMSFNISDEGIFHITKVLYAEFLSQNRAKKLDIHNLDEFKRTHIKPLYPHKQITYRNGSKGLQKYQCGQYCCKFSPGRFCCCSSTPPSPEYKQFGLGVCLYKKFIKHIIAFLFMVCILAMISIAVYCLVALQNGLKVSESYHNTLFSTTIGAVSSQYLQCKYSKIQSNFASFNIDCANGEVKLLSPVFSQATLENMLNCRNQSLKISQNQFIPILTQNITSNTNNGGYEVNLTIESNIYETKAYQYLSYNYQCINSSYKISNFQFNSSYVMYLTIGIDLFIIVAFIFFLISEHKAQENEIEYFKMKELAIHDFTVKVGGFNLTNLQEDLQLFIEEYGKIRNQTLRQNGGTFFNAIVQIKVPEVEQIKEASEQRKEYYEKLYDLLDENFFDDEIDINRYKNADDFIRKCYGNERSASYIQYKKKLTKLMYLFLQSKKVQNLDKDQETAVLMTLSNPKDKKLMVKNFRRGCFGNQIKLRNRKFDISEPPIADMVIWENKTKYTCIRVIIAWVITLAIVLGSYLLVAFASFKKQQSLSNNKFNVGCQLFYKNHQLSSWNEALSLANPQVYTHCYCYENYISLIQNGGLKDKCGKWFDDFIIYSGIPILISFGIVIYNMIVDRIFKCLSRFEAHGQLSTQLYSYIIKRSFILIMNMGLIIILIKMNYRNNIKIDNLGFLFQGTYTDITSDWYLQIGTIIILTLAFNIIIPLADMLFISLLKCIKKCIDKRCCCVKTSKKTKKDYLQLYSNDVFPIQARYSDFIAMIVICLAFSAIMPILYLIVFFSLWFMYACDKFLLFRIYQKPINYSQDIQNKVFKLLYIAVMIHCVTSPFILTQPHLIQAGSNSSITSRFRLIITTPYLIPYVALFAILAVWGVLDSTLISCFGYFMKKCSKQASKIYRSKLNQNLFFSLSQYQKTKLKMSLELQLNNNVEHSKKISNVNVTKKICQNSLTKIKQLENQNLGNQGNQGQGIRLIGKVGYDEMFDDQIFNREKKIRSIDYQLQDILRIQKQRSKMLKNYNVQHTTGQFNV